MKRLAALVLVVSSQGAWAAEKPPVVCQDLNASLEMPYPQGFELRGDYSEFMRYLDHCPLPETLPFLRTLTEQAEQIRNVASGDTFCHGTIERMQVQRYLFQLALTSTAPQVFATARMTGPEPATLQNYLNNWALRSPSNYALYQAFSQSRREAQPLLARHYQEHFGLPPDEATVAADNALELIARRAAGVYPGAGRERQPSARTTVFPVTALLSAPDFQPEALTQALAGKPSAQELDQALKMALARDLPLPVLTELVSHMDSLDAGDESALFFALRNPAALTLLLNHGATVDYANGFGKTALFYAIESGNPQAVNLLLDQGANPNHTYKTAQQLKALECVYKIEHSARTPLMHAAQHSDIALLTVLLNRGARLDAVDGVGWTAIDYAARNGRAENAAFLAGISAKAPGQ